MVELRIQWLVPFIVLFSLLVNYSLANASSLHVDQFAPVVLRPARLANYAQDPASLAFPAVDPQLYEQVLQDQALGSAGQSITQPGGAANGPIATPSPGVTGTPGQTSGTPQAGVTLPGILPTTVGVVSTVIGVVPPVVDAVEDLANQIVPGAGDIVSGAGEIISGATDPIIELIPPILQLPQPEPQPAPQPTATPCKKLLGLCLP